MNNGMKGDRNNCYLKYYILKEQAFVMNHFGYVFKI